MAFLCPVRIRSNNSNNGTRKKKQAESGKKHRSFLSATVNSIINSDESNNANDNNNTTTTGSSPSITTGPGRITGSSSIETLVRVGLEKEAGIPPEARNMVVLHDFTPCVDDELEVRRGSVVSILYRENDWVYVILEQLPNGACVTDDNNTGSSREGFIPHSYCAPFGSPLAEMALCSGGNNAGVGSHGKGGRSSGSDRCVSLSSNNTNSNNAQSRLASMSDSETLRRSQPIHGSRHPHHPHSSFDDSNHSSNNSTTTVPFYKDPSPTRYIALYKFTARDENDVNVERGEILTVLNKDDPDWFYVVRSDGQEGFVPSAFVYPLTQQGHGGSNASSQQPTYQQIPEDHEYAGADMHLLQQQPSPASGGAIRLSGASGGADFSQSPTSVSPSGTTSPAQQQQYGTELVMLYDYKAQAPDDLSVRRGDWVYADLLHQTVEGWLWAFAPKQRKYGFIPKAYARPPAMTSL